MVRHNSVIPNGHFHKNWQCFVKTWFNQPMRKKRRANLRQAKHQARLPKPSQLLRPMVRCPSLRYNSKMKPGRGFTLRELKAVGLNKRFAISVGISVDYRRINKSIEQMRLNVQRLREYQCKLVVFPLNKKKARAEMNKPLETVTKAINKSIKVSAKLKSRIPTKAEKKFSAYTAVKMARADSKYVGVRLMRKKMKGENVDFPTRKVRLRPDTME